MCPSPLEPKRLLYIPDVSQALSYKIWSYSAGLWFWLSMVVLMPWFFSFKVRKYLTCFVHPILPIIQELSLETSIIFMFILWYKHEDLWDKQKKLWFNSNVFVYPVDKGSIVLISFCQPDTNLSHLRRGNLNWGSSQWPVSITMGHFSFSSLTFLLLWFYFLRLGLNYVTLAVLEVTI